MDTLALEVLSSKMAKPTVYRLSFAQRTRLHKLGEKLYGDAWPAEADRCARSVSHGTATSINALSPHYADVLMRQFEVQLNNNKNESRLSRK